MTQRPTLTLRHRVWRVGDEAGCSDCPAVQQERAAETYGAADGRSRCSPWPLTAALGSAGRGGVVRLLFSVCLGLTLVSQPAYAQTPSAVSTTDRHHPFVEHAESRYRQYLASESEGDVAAYKAVRTRQANERVMENLKRMEKSETDLGPMLLPVIQSELAWSRASVAM